MNYQTVKYGDGRTETGVFDTQKYFDVIKSVVPFRGKSVLELGCNTGMYLLYAKQAGAEYVMGIDIDNTFLTTAKDIFTSFKYDGNFIQGNAEEFYPIRKFDVVMCPMILHWMENPERHLRRFLKLTNEYFVVVYREQNDGYDMENHWFPTQETMNVRVESMHFDLVHSEIIEVQGDKNIILSIYKRYKYIDIKDGVISKCSDKYDDQWVKNMNTFASRLQYTPFIKTIRIDGRNGYEMKFLNGYDLCGDKPFHYELTKKIDSLSKKEKEIVLKSVKDLFRVGMETGIIVGDITKHNFIFFENKAYFIDFNPFIAVENKRINDLDYITIIGGFLKEMGVDGFNGNLEIL